MTAERDTVSVGVCGACGGPAQFIAPASHANGCTFRIGSVCICSEPIVRHVSLPNIAEDLGGGWTLMEINRLLLSNRNGHQWRAVAEGLNGSKWGDIEYGWGDSPSAAYLALRTAIEARS